MYTNDNSINAKQSILLATNSHTFTSWFPYFLVTPVRCMVTANFINFEVWVWYTLSKHNIFSTKPKNRSSLFESLKRSVLKTGNTFLRLNFQKLFHFHFIHKDNANGVGKVAEVSYCYYSRDSHEIVWKFPCMEVAKSTHRDWTFWDVFACGPARTFSETAPCEGLMSQQHRGPVKG